MVSSVSTHKFEMISSLKPSIEDYNSRLIKNAVLKSLTKLLLIPSFHASVLVFIYLYIYLYLVKTSGL